MCVHTAVVAIETMKQSVLNQVSINIMQIGNRHSFVSQLKASWFIHINPDPNFFRCPNVVF